MRTKTLSVALSWDKVCSSGTMESCSSQRTSRAGSRVAEQVEASEASVPRRLDVRSSAHTSRRISGISRQRGAISARIRSKGTWWEEGRRKG